MTGLSDSRPEDLLRCGVIFGQMSEQVDEAARSARRSASVVWDGVAASCFRRDLNALAVKLARVTEAYDEACDLLWVYSRELDRARDVSRMADTLAIQAVVEQSPASFLGPTNIEAHQAVRLAGEAFDLQTAASRRVVSTLHDLTQRAPRADAGSATDRWIGEAGEGLWSSLVGVKDVLVDVVESLPHVGTTAERASARHDVLPPRNRACPGCRWSSCSLRPGSTTQVSPPVRWRVACCSEGSTEGANRVSSSASTTRCPQPF